VKIRGLIIGCMVCLAASIALIVFALWQRKTTLDETNHRICVAIRNIDVVVTAQLERSRHNLPKLAYFREHPSELHDQQNRIEEQLRAFRPRDCR
jgi:hypothetical protein